MSVAEVLRRWSERLCFVSELTPEGLARAVEMTGELRPELDYARVEPPPLGALWALVVGGQVAPHIELAFDEGLLTRGGLDAGFGEGRWLPRVDYDRPHMLAYEVRVEDAPNRCTVFGRFPEQPRSPEVPVTGVTLRVDP